MFVCVRVCVCMFCLFTPFLSVLLAGQNLKRDGQGGGNIGGRGRGLHKIERLNTHEMKLARNSIPACNFIPLL